MSSKQIFESDEARDEFCRLVRELKSAAKPVELGARWGTSKDAFEEDCIHLFSLMNGLSLYREQLELYFATGQRVSATAAQVVEKRLIALCPDEN